MSIDPARLSFNEITADHLSLEQVVEACAEAGIGWLAPWRHKLTPGAAELIRGAGLRMSSLCRSRTKRSDGVNTLRRAAASSMARGSPSSRRQISAIIGAF